MSQPVPVTLKAVNDALQIVWSDGVTHRLTWRLLREACPCATCREERAASMQGATAAHASPAAPPAAGSNLLPVLPIEQTRPLRVSSMQPVGNYAYDIDFTDGHNTGIYTIEYLRTLGEGTVA